MTTPSRSPEPTRRGFVGTTKLFVARLVTRPEVGRVIGWVWRDRVPSAVGRVDTTDPAVSDAVKARLALRLYETAELRFLQAHLPSDFDVVELGASLGVITRAACARLTPGRRVLAVEANPHLIAPLQANLDLGGVADRVTVVHAAVIAGNEPTISLTLGPSSTDAHVTAAGMPDLEVVEVPARRLGQLLADNEVRGDYALIADIEGAEAGILRRDADALANCRFLLIELHDTSFEGQTVQWTEMADDLVELGFDVVAQHGPVLVCRR